MPLSDNLQPPPAESTVSRSILSVDRAESSRRSDRLAVEEPLEVRVVVESGGKRERYPFAVTMRTPGDDFALAAGFLFAEGLLAGRESIWKLDYCVDPPADSEGNVVEVYLTPGSGEDFDPERYRRNTLATSSCGVCGKATLEQLRFNASPPVGEYRIPSATLRSLPRELHEEQPVFHHTGGLHAAGLFDSAGKLLLLREDVGRHNALDKVVGTRLLSGELPASNTLIVVSGRASYELVQKVVMAGIPTIAAVGAPSSLAVATAEEFGVTLIGFLKEDRFNVYAGEHRVET